MKTAITYTMTKGNLSDKVLKDRSKLKEKGVRIISVSEPISEDEGNLSFAILEENEQ